MDLHAFSQTWLLMNQETGGMDLHPVAARPCGVARLRPSFAGNLRMPWRHTLTLIWRGRSI